MFTPKTTLSCACAQLPQLTKVPKHNDPSQHSNAKSIGRMEPGRQTSRLHYEHRRLTHHKFCLNTLNIIRLAEPQFPLCSYCPASHALPMTRPQRPALSV